MKAKLREKILERGREEIDGYFDIVHLVENVRDVTAFLDKRVQGWQVVARQDRLKEVWERVLAGSVLPDHQKEEEKEKDADSSKEAVVSQLLKPVHGQGSILRGGSGFTTNTSLKEGTGQTKNGDARLN